MNGAAQFAVELSTAKITIETLKESVLSQAMSIRYLNALTSDEVSQNYEAALKESFNDRSGTRVNLNKFGTGSAGNETLNKFTTEISGWDSYQWGRNIGYFGSSVAFTYGVGRTLTSAATTTANNPLVKEIETFVQSNDATKGINRAFWTGSGTEAKALSDGFQTLGQTRAGQNLIKLTKEMPYYPAMNGQPASSPKSQS